MMPSLDQYNAYVRITYLLATIMFTNIKNAPKIMFTNIILHNIKVFVNIFLKYALAEKLLCYNTFMIGMIMLR